MIIIQSYIDLITNSSTSVFQCANNIEGVKDIINAVLKASGSNLTCDDLFNIELHYDIYAEEYNINSDEFKYSSYYIIKAKNPENEKYEKILYNLNNLFDYDAMYC